jgi:hypothetical protein
VKNFDPLYVSTDDDATYLRRLANLGPDDIAVVTSALSGPFPFDERLVRRITQLRLRGVTVLGYVSLDYGRRWVGSVLDDIVAWRRKYSVVGLFLDEWPSEWGSEYINTLWGSPRSFAGRATTADPMFLVVNPGVGVTLAGGLGDGAFIVEHEGSEMPMTKPNPWSIAIVHSVAHPNVARSLLAAWGWPYGYCTSDTMPNPYDNPSNA